MALTVASPRPVPGTRAPGRSGSLTAGLGQLLSLAVCVLGVAAVALPAMSTAPLPAPGGTVHVAVLGQISTAGLPAKAAVSTLSVRNTGTAPLQWSARPEVTGAGAAGVVVEAWVPARPGCTGPTRLLEVEHWSEHALPPGATTPVCVRVRTTGTSGGAATPLLTVVARAI